MSGPPTRNTSVLRPGPIQRSRPDRSVADAPPIASQQGQAQDKTDIKTYLTDPDGVSRIIYNGDRLWAKVVLWLETAGPVAVGNMANITPVLSGKGELLETGEPMEFIIAKGTRLYIASTSILARTAASRAYLDAVIAGGRRREEIPFKKVRPAGVTVAPYSAAMLQTPSKPPATADPAVFSIDVSDDVWAKLEAFSSLVGKPVDDVAEYILKQSMGAPTDRAA